MTRFTIIAVVMLASLGCASGPHPAVTMASKDFKCPAEKLTRHEIYTNKQRVEGCGKEAVYIKGCTGYGVGSECAWVKQPIGGK